MPKRRIRVKKKTEVLHDILPQTDGQQRLLDAIQKKAVVICDGPAGTGKTFISFGSALRYCIEDPNIQRIVIVRPTIGAGDEPRLGFLPGTLNDKMAPFLAPILRDSAPLLLKARPRTNSEESFITRFGNNRSQTDILLSQFDIETVPLHLMRGRTFNNSFVVLDEAQNCNMGDFKLFLTRIGKRSRVIIEGDSTQKDRSDGSLPELISKLEKLACVATVKLDYSDIVRNKMISDILKCLD